MSDTNVVNEIGEFSFNVGKLIAEYYKEYYAKNPDITPIQDIKNINVIKENEEAYTKPMICALIADILRKSSERDTWAAMIMTYYQNFIKSGFTTYDAIDSCINLFRLKWDRKDSYPSFELVDTNVDVTLPSYIDQE